jgi:hypothetical protein
MFEPVNDLERSLMNAATNASARPQFLRDLLQSDIFVLNQKGEDFRVEGSILQKGAKLNVLSFERDGKTWLPIFTSLQRLEQFIRVDSNYVQLKAKDFFEITRGAFVVLNPGFEYGKEFLPREIEQLLDGSIFKPMQTYTAQKPTQVLIGQPAVYPHTLVNTLSAYFEKNPQVNKVYLAQYFNPQMDDKPHLLICIDGKGDWQQLLGDAGMVASEMIGSGEVIDFMRIDNSGLAKSVVKQIKPFFARKSFLGNLFG